MHLVARFIRFYGGHLYRNANWPTRDGVIPYQLFWILLAELPSMVAVEQLQAYYPAVLALGQWHGDKDSRRMIERAIRALTAAAYPAGA